MTRTLSVAAESTWEISELASVFGLGAASCGADGAGFSGALAGVESWPCAAGRKNGRAIDRAIHKARRHNGLRQYKRALIPSLAPILVLTRNACTDTLQTASRAGGMH